VRRVALTGGIATGKSYVRRRLEAAGVPTIDADVLAREAVAPGSPALAAIAERFGPAILDCHGALDRPAMGRLVFSNPALRRDLEAIVHPVVRAATDAWFARLNETGTAPFAVADIPLLYETGRAADFERVIVTACPEATQIARIVARDGLSEADARARIAAQWPLAEKVRRADYVVDTGGSFEETDRQVEAIVRKLGQDNGARRG
jgi:dephospho-CoA kinase